MTDPNAGVNEMWCDERHPLISDAICHRLKGHASSHCAVVNGMHRSWTDAKPEPGQHLQDVMLAAGAKDGGRLGARFGALANYYAAFAMGLNNALKEAGFGDEESEGAPESDVDPDDILLLDSVGNAWIRMGDDAWVRANPLQRSNLTRTRAQIEKAGNTPLIEYVRRRPS